MVWLSASNAMELFSGFIISRTVRMRPVAGSMAMNQPSCDCCATSPCRSCWTTCMRWRSKCTLHSDLLVAVHDKLIGGTPLRLAQVVCMPPIRARLSQPSTNGLSLLMAPNQLRRCRRGTDDILSDSCKHSRYNTCAAENSFRQITCSLSSSHRTSSCAQAIAVALTAPGNCSAL